MNSYEAIYDALKSNPEVSSNNLLKIKNDATLVSIVKRICGDKESNDLARRIKGKKVSIESIAKELKLSNNMAHKFCLAVNSLKTIELINGVNFRSVSGAGRKVKEETIQQKERNVNMRVVEFKNYIDAQKAQEALLFLFKEGIFPPIEIIKIDKSLAFIKEIKDEK